MLSTCNVVAMHSVEITPDTMPNQTDSLRTDTADRQEEEEDIFDFVPSKQWQRMIKAIAIVESSGNPRAHGGNSIGLLQITPVCVKQCNILLRQKGSKKRYTLSDRYSPSKSKEMFEIYQNAYNPSKNIEKAIRIWNGGPNYSVKRTNGYYRKVMRKMKSLS